MATERICAGCGVVFCPLPIPGRPPAHCGLDCKDRRDAARCRRRYATVNVSARFYRRLVAAAEARGLTAAALVDAAIGPTLAGGAA